MEGVVQRYTGPVTKTQAHVTGAVCRDESTVCSIRYAVAAPVTDCDAHVSGSKELCRHQHRTPSPASGQPAEVRVSPSLALWCTRQ